MKLYYLQRGQKCRGAVEHVLPEVDVLRGSAVCAAGGDLLRAERDVALRDVAGVSLPQGKGFRGLQLDEARFAGSMFDTVIVSRLGDSPDSIVTSSHNNLTAIHSASTLRP